MTSLRVIGAIAAIGTTQYCLIIGSIGGGIEIIRAIGAIGAIGG